MIKIKHNSLGLIKKVRLPKGSRQFLFSIMKKDKNIEMSAIESIANGESQVINLSKEAAENEWLKSDGFRVMCPNEDRFIILDGNTDLGIKASAFVLMTSNRKKGFNHLYKHELNTIHNKAEFKRICKHFDFDINYFPDLKEYTYLIGNVNDELFDAICMYVATYGITRIFLSGNEIKFIKEA